MKRVSFLLILAFILSLTIPSFAQEEGGQGGVVFYYDTSDVSQMNPLLGEDATSSSLYGRLYPSLFGVDPTTGLLEKGAPGTLATDWSFDETGTVLTITLRQDAFWSDGTQITSADYVWGVEALRSGLLETSRAGQMWETLDDGTPGSGSVVDVVAVDDFTVQVTFARPNCNAINELAAFAVPSHIYEADFGDDLAAMNADPLYDPGVYFGAWMDPEIIAGDRWAVVANQGYPDAVLGYVNPAEVVNLTLPNVDVAVERFRAGELTLIGIPGTQQAEFANDPNFQTYRSNRLGYVFYAFNHANPANPQSAYDEAGNLITQEAHPILGDKLVRQALVTAVDMDAIIQNNLGGNAVRVGIPSIPASFDWNGDLQYPFDPAAAAQMLTDAGWEDTDGNGFRECVSCANLAANPDYAGTEMVLILNASAGGSADSDRMVEFIAQSFRDIGVNATVEFLDWGSAFLPELTGQTFDMAILAWSLGVPLDPDNSSIFGTEADIPEEGFNFGSYINPELDQIYKDALDPSKTDGCSIEGRAALYARANEIIFDELPYMFMYSNLTMSAAQLSLENWEPAPFSTTWNEDAFDTVGGE